jgi:hypothetical protein
MTNDPTLLRLRAENVAWREFDGEAILLDLRTSTYLTTNPAATVLWRLLERGATRLALVEALVAEFGIAHERATEDVATFLDDCRARDLIREDRQR